MQSPEDRDRLGAMMVIGALLTLIPHEISGDRLPLLVSCGFTVTALLLFAPQASRTGKLFLWIGAALFMTALATLDNAQPAILDALTRGAFIAAFFTALTVIRSAAVTDPGILECGRFLADQPPGRRYAALTIGGHLFGLILMYGSISLLGALATENAEREPNEEIRYHRRRRMLVAIQRGFISTLTWSPLTFASAISLSVVPGATWAGALPYTFAAGLLLAASGWALDSIFKPKLAAPAPPRGPAEGRWLHHLRPLFVLLFVILGTVAALHVVAGVRIFGAVMIGVPAISLAWVAAQARGTGSVWSRTMSRASAFALDDLPGLRAELVLLIMAGIIGSLGAAVASPIAASAGLDLSAIRAEVLLLAVFWLIPVTGQIGMNPILAVSLFGPFLPAPETLGIAPAVMICAITGGWALSGATSPFTASVLLISAFGRIDAARVGFRWNGLYALTCGVLLSIWICVLAELL